MQVLAVRIFFIIGAYSPLGGCGERALWWAMLALVKSRFLPRNENEVKISTSAADLGLHFPHLRRHVAQQLPWAQPGRARRCQAAP